MDNIVDPYLPTDTPSATGPAFRRMRALTGCYAALSVLTLGAAALLRDDAAAGVTAAVWVRSSIVAVSSLVLLACVGRAARGSLGALRRLRVLSAVMLAAIVVIVALPGAFPVWLRVEQAVCGVLLAGVLATACGRAVRAGSAGR